jgi:hypothetical protein
MAVANEKVGVSGSGRDSSVLVRALSLSDLSELNLTIEWWMDTYYLNKSNTL